MKFDAIVLGAGAVGVSSAIHLRRRGLSVALVDRKGAGLETSFGNAGIIERSSLLPLAFPRDPALLLRVILKRAPQANYHLRDLPALAPWLWAYFRHGTPQRLEASAIALHPLVDRCLIEHEDLMEAAGALHLLAKRGWMRLYRQERDVAGDAADFALADRLGIPYEIKTQADALALEPHLAPVFAKAVVWPTTGSVSDPGALIAAYAKHFEEIGGVFVNGDATTLKKTGGGWEVMTANGPVTGSTVVAALGPWGGDFARKFGLNLPFAVKRGYHMHFKPTGNAGLNRPIVDPTGGYALAPMAKGLRLTTGIEFADRDAPATPAQLDRSLRHARELVPELGSPVDPQPWKGARPCLPDSLPVIGTVPGEPSLYLNFGHQHLGLTLGPVSGRLVAEMVTGAPTVVDPKPYSPTRFQ